VKAVIGLLYDCIIVGGGIAGLQAAIQLGRYEHRVLVIDAGNGRSTLCRSYNNLLGWPNGISGQELRKLGKAHAEGYGIIFIEDEVIRAEGRSGEFLLRLQKDTTAHYKARTLLLATGVMDRFPNLPGLVSCLGLSIFVCPDCDGYEVRNRRTLVLGSGLVGADMGLTLYAYTRDLIYINHEKQPITQQMLNQLAEKEIRYIEEAIESIITGAEGQFKGVRLVNGSKVEGECAFIAFGGNEVRTQLAQQLGAERLDNKHIVTDPRSKMTSVPHVWAAGDAAVHAEQVSVAMGEGSLSAIWIHKALVELKSIKAEGLAKAMVGQSRKEAKHTMANNNSNNNNNAANNNRSANSALTNATSSVDTNQSTQKNNKLNNNKNNTANNTTSNEDETDQTTTNL
jgi:thioredoxin reductase (NADPH)